MRTTRFAAAATAAILVVGFGVVGTTPAAAAVRSTACMAFGSLPSQTVGATFHASATSYSFTKGETLTVTLTPVIGFPAPTLVTLDLPAGTTVASTTSIPGSLIYVVPDSTTVFDATIRVTEGSTVYATFSCTAAGPPTNDSGPVTGTVDISGATGSEGSTLAATGMFGDPDGFWVGSITQTEGIGAVVDHGNGTWSWSLTPTDNDSGWVTVSASDGVHTPVAIERFRWTATNIAPTATLTPPGDPVPEGSTFDLSLTGALDPSTADIAEGLEYGFDCGSGYGPFGSSTIATCATAGDGPTTLSVGGKVRDKDGGVTTYSTTVDVTDVAPSVDATVDTSVDCRAVVTVTLSFSDPGLDDGPWTIGVDWGDGASTTSTASTQGAQADVTHVYTAAGIPRMTVTVADADGSVGTYGPVAVTVYPTFAVTFSSPIAASTAEAVVPNRVNIGQVVPVKAVLYDQCARHYVVDPTSDVSLVLTPTASTIPVATSPMTWTSRGNWGVRLDTGSAGLLAGADYRADIQVAGVTATTGTWAMLTSAK